MRTGRHDEANNRFSQFCERAYYESVKTKFDGNVADRTSKYQIRNTRIICRQLDNKNYAQQTIEISSFRRNLTDGFVNL